MGRRAPDEPGLPVGLRRVELLPGRREEDVGGEFLPRRQVRPVEERLLAHGTPELEIAEGAAEASFEGIVLGGRNPCDDATDALGGDRIRVGLAFDEDEAAVAAVFSVLSEDGVGGGAGPGEGIEDDGVAVGGQEDHALD